MPTIEQAIKNYVLYRNHARDEKHEGNKQSYRHVANAMYNTAIDLAVEEGKRSYNHYGIYRPNDQKVFKGTCNVTNGTTFPDCKYVLQFDAEFVLPKINWSFDHEKVARSYPQISGDWLKR